VKVILKTDNNVTFELAGGDKTGTALLTVDDDTGGPYIASIIDFEFIKALVEYFGKIAGVPNMTLSATPTMVMRAEERKGCFS
jgi:hypothetical protein